MSPAPGPRSKDWPPRPAELKTTPPPPGSSGDGSSLRGFGPGLRPALLVLWAWACGAPRGQVGASETRSLGAQGPSRNFHVATSQTSAPAVWAQDISQEPGGVPGGAVVLFCQDWWLERGPGVLHLRRRGWGEASSPQSCLGGSELTPPRATGPSSQSSLLLGLFFTAPSRVLPQTGCGCSRPHPEAGRPGSCESVGAHSWACPWGTEAGEGGSPCGSWRGRGPSTVQPPAPGQHSALSDPTLAINPICGGLCAAELAAYLWALAGRPRAPSTSPEALAIQQWAKWTGALFSGCLCPCDGDVPDLINQRKTGPVRRDWHRGPEVGA